MKAKQVLFNQLLKEKSVWLEQIEFAEDKEALMKVQEYINVLNDKIERLAIELN